VLFFAQGEFPFFYSPFRLKFNTATPANVPTPVSARTPDLYAPTSLQLFRLRFAGLGPDAYSSTPGAKI